VEGKQRNVAVWLVGRNASLDHLPRDLRTYRVVLMVQLNDSQTELTVNQYQRWVNRRHLRRDKTKRKKRYVFSPKRSSASQKVSRL